MTMLPRRRVIAASETVQLILPFPPPELSPNARLSWQAKRRVVADYRRTCGLLALNVRRDLERQGMKFPLRVPVTATVTFVLTSRARRDMDNLLASAKALFDGVVDSGLLADDDCWSLRLAMAVELGLKQEVRLWLQEAEL